VRLAQIGHVHKFKAVNQLNERRHYHHGYYKSGYKTKNAWLVLLQVERELQKKALVRHKVQGRTK
jgi:RNase P protein component